MKNRKLITEVFDELNISYDVERDYVDDCFGNVERAIDLIVEREIVNRLMIAREKLSALHKTCK